MTITLRAVKGSALTHAEMDDNFETLQALAAFSVVVTGPDYGAVGDGTTNDTTFIQNAINAVYTAGGGRVLLPEGTYSVTGLTIKANVSLIGAGKGTIIKLAAATDAPVIKSDGFVTGGTLGSGEVTGFGIYDLVVDGNRGNQSAGADVLLQNGLSLAGHDFIVSGVQIKNCYGCGIRTSLTGTALPIYPKETAVFEKVFIDSSGAHGFMFGGPTDSYLHNVDIRDSGQNTDDTYYGFYNAATSVRMADSHIWNSNTAAASGIITTNRPAYAVYDAAGNCEFSNTHIEGARQCAYLGGSYTSFVNCRFYYPFSNDPAVEINNNSIQMAACKIISAGSVTEGGSPVTYNSRLIKFGGTNAPILCQIDATVSTGADYAIEFANDGGRNDINLTVYGNTAKTIHTGTIAATTAFAARRDGGAAGMEIANWNSRTPYRKVTFTDDFIGDVLADQWNGRIGSDPQCATPTFVGSVQNGIVRLYCGDDAAATMAVNGCQLESALQWQASTGGLVIEFRLRILGSVTAVCIFAGLTDQVSALEMPFVSAASADTITSNASDAVGVMFDTAMSTDNWWLCGVKADTDATHQNSAVAPVLSTFEVWRIELDASGNATFFRNGALIGSTLSNALTATANLTPVFAAFSRSTTQVTVDVDYVHIEKNRA